MKKKYWWCLLQKNNIELIREFVLNKIPFKLTVLYHRPCTYLIEPYENYFIEYEKEIFIYANVFNCGNKITKIGGRCFTKSLIIKVEKC